MDKTAMIQRAVKIGQNPVRAEELLEDIISRNQTNLWNLVYELRYWQFITDRTANKILGA